jgi:polysaccharide biosynthesis/export protein
MPSVSRKGPGAVFGGAGRVAGTPGVDAPPLARMERALAAWSRFCLPAARQLLVTALLLGTPPLASPQTASPGDSAQLTANGLGPGDYIQVEIWREPDLSDTLQVDHTGTAVFPKLGRIQVSGIRTDSLERLLLSEYSRYLRNPSIRVTVMRRIAITGAVQRPGTYPVDLTMTITDALALAGGPNTEGKSDEVELRRGNTRKRIDLKATTGRLDELALRSGDQLFVDRRSWVSRNPGVIFAVIGTLTSLVYLFRRY